MPTLSIVTKEGSTREVSGDTIWLDLGSERRAFYVVSDPLIDDCPVLIDYATGRSLGSIAAHQRWSGEDNIFAAAQDLVNTAVSMHGLERVRGKILAPTILNIHTR